MANESSTDLITTMAQRFAMLPESFARTCKSICFPDGKATDEQFLAFLAIASGHNLNPFTREIYAFPRPHGGVQAIVSIDGWMKIINSHPQFDGMEFVDKVEGGKLLAITCRIHRKDRKHPVECTEYLRECLRNTEPWQKWPGRMLRHKAAIQAARYAFGFAGIIDPDESQRYDIETTAEPVEEEVRPQAAVKKTEPVPATASQGRLAGNDPQTGSVQDNSGGTPLRAQPDGEADWTPEEKQAGVRVVLEKEAEGNGSPAAELRAQPEERDETEIGKVEGEKLRQMAIRAGLKSPEQRAMLASLKPLAVSFENVRMWQLESVFAAIEAKGAK